MRADLGFWEAHRRSDRPVRCQRALRVGGRLAGCQPCRVQPWPRPCAATRRRRHHRHHRGRRLNWSGWIRQQLQLLVSAAMAAAAAAKRARQRQQRTSFRVDTAGLDELVDHDQVDRSDQHRRHRAGGQTRPELPHKIRRPAGVPRGATADTCPVQSETGTLSPGRHGRDRSQDRFLVHTHRTRSSKVCTVPTVARRSWSHAAPIAPFHSARERSPRPPPQPCAGFDA